MDHCKVLLVAPLPPPYTGQSIAVQALRDHLRLCAGVNEVNTSKAGLHSGVRSVARVLAVARSLVKIVRDRAGSDVIYFNCSQSVSGNLRDLLVYALCWRRLGNMVVHLHGGAGMRELLGAKHPVLRALNRVFLKRVGAVVVLGNRLKSIYDGMVPPERVHAVANFAGDECFIDEARCAEKFRSMAPLRLLFLSNLLPGKGHLELLAALALLSPALQSQLVVDFAGGFESAQDEQSFRRAVQAVPGVAITVHGVVQGAAKQALLAQAHLFCLPTYYAYEGQPVSILEAYAAGCAVLTTNHGGIFDTFTPEVNGLEVMPQSPESIKAALERALAHPAQLALFGQTNLQAAQRHYRLATHVAALMQTLKSVQL